MTVPRVNACPNPAAKVDATGWGGGATRVTGLVGMTRTTGVQIPGNSFTLISTAPSAAAEGERWAVSVDVRPVTAGDVEIKLEWLGPSGFIASITDTETIGAGTPVRLSLIGTAPAGATRVQLVVTTFTSGTPVVDITAALIERAPDVGPYLDGDTAGASWDGTNGSSTSTLPDGPVVAGRASGRTTGGATTSHAATLPSGIQSSVDRLTVIYSCDSGPTLTADAASAARGWAKVAGVEPGSVVGSAIFEKLATGDDALTVTSSFNEESSHIALRVPGATAPVATSTSGNAANSNPPAITPTGGAIPRLYVTALANEALRLPTAAPSGYGNLTTQVAETASGASIATAERTATVATEDPGPWTCDAEDHVSWTIAMRAVAQARVGYGAGPLGGLTGAAAGGRRATGSADGALGALTGTATGTRRVTAAAAGSLGQLAGAAAGTVTVLGAAAGALGALTGAAAGTVTAEVVNGAGVGQLGQLTGVAAGVRGVAGSAAGPLGALTGAAAGLRTVRATADGALGQLLGAAAGDVQVSGTGAGALGQLAGAAAGTRTVTGAGVGALGELVGDAVGAGTGTGAGAGVGPLGALVGVATGRRDVTGSGSAPLGQLAGAGAGTRTVRGAAAGPLGALAGAAAGIPVRLGVAAGALGGLVGAAAAARAVTGAGSGPLGAVVGAAAGVRTVLGVAGAPLPGLAAAAAGQRTVRGEAVGLLGPLLGTSAGDDISTVPGVAEGALGQLFGQARGTGTRPQGSWQGLLTILRGPGVIDSRESGSCPNDGTPYRDGPDGRPYCPFDGYRPDGPPPRRPVLTGRSWGGLRASPSRVGRRVADDDRGWGG